MYIYIYKYIYINLPVNAIACLPHPRSGDSQSQETFLAPSADKQTRNYDTECSNHHPSPSTLRSLCHHHSLSTLSTLCIHMLLMLYSLLKH